MRNNRKEFPETVLPCARREVHSTDFLFCNFRTLVYYVPKGKKAVNLLSTQHYDKAMDTTSECKTPQMWCFTYSTQRGCDTFDQMVAEYSCRRSTHRWNWCITKKVWEEEKIIEASGVPKRHGVYRPIDYIAEHFEHPGKELIHPMVSANDKEHPGTPTLFKLHSYCIVYLIIEWFVCMYAICLCLFDSCNTFHVLFLHGINI